MRHDIQLHSHKAYTSSNWDQDRVNDSTVKKEKWLQGYCSAQLSELQEHAVLLRPLLWPAGWRQEVSIVRSFSFKARNVAKIWVCEGHVGRGELSRKPLTC